MSEDFPAGRNPRLAPTVRTTTPSLSLHHTPLRSARPRIRRATERLIRRPDGRSPRAMRVFSSMTGTVPIASTITDANGMFFASEAKALLAVLPELRRLDVTGLAQTLACGCSCRIRTLFSGRRLAPREDRDGGSLARKTSAEERYFDPNVGSQPALDEVAFSDALTSTFSRVLPGYIEDRARRAATAMSLTGGLDGRMIMAWARQPPGSLPCYSFSSAYRESARDSRDSRGGCARYAGQPHQTIVVGRPSSRSSRQPRAKDR